MNDILKEMLNKYNCISKDDYINAFKEIVQEVALYSLSLTDFFDNAAFYGGTALRIFYNLDRFSEDLDFSLCTTDKQFSLEKYFEQLSKSFEIMGLNFVPQIKEKNIDSNVQSAFLKGNTLEHILLVNPKSDIASYIQKNEIIKIKFEIDTNPPSGSTFEYKYNMTPLPYKVRLYDEGSLFAGKVHALLCRSWNKRIKGRDLYDFEFYVKNRCLLNINHLRARMIQTGHLKEDEELTLNKVKELLYKKFNELDFDKAKQDVFPFINNISKLNIWEKEYFIYLTEQLCDNIVKIYNKTLDISNIAIANIVNEELIEEIAFSSRNAKSTKLKELNIKYNKFIITDDEILNFENKLKKQVACFIIEDSNEKIYITNNFDIKKIISLLKE